MLHTLKRAILRRFFPTRWRDQCLYDLMLPGLRGELWKCANEAPPRNDWNAIDDSARIWLRAWIPRHRHDFKQAFRPSAKAWLEEEIRARDWRVERVTR